MNKYIEERIKQLEEQLSSPECNNPIKVEHKLEAYKEMQQQLKNCNLQSVNGWHLFSEQKPTEGDNIEVYYDDKLIVNVGWQDYLYNDKEFKHMRFWRACR